MEKGDFQRVTKVTNQASSSSKSRRSGSTREKRLFFLVLLIGSSAVVFLALFLAEFMRYYGVARSAGKLQKNLCLTLDCVKTAAMIIEKLDPTVNPCEDFANFACGNYYKTVSFDEGEVYKTNLLDLERLNLETQKRILSEMVKPRDLDFQKNMKNYYQSCMYTAQIEKIGIQPYLNTPLAKEWPTLIGPTWAGAATFNISEVNARYTPIGVEPLIKFTVELDPWDKPFIRLGLREPQTRLTKDVLALPKTSPVLVAYVKYLQDFAIALGADATVAQQDAQAVLDLEIQLGKILPSAQDKMNVSAMYNPKSLLQLETLFPYVGSPPGLGHPMVSSEAPTGKTGNLDLRKGIQAAFDLTGTTLRDDQRVEVLFTGYFNKLGAVLGAADKRALMNLYGFAAAFKLVGGLTAKLRDVRLKWLKVKLGQQEEDPRWKQCVMYTAHVFKFGLSKEFVRRAFTEEDKTNVNAMVDNLKASFREILRDSFWMYNSTKQLAYAKLDKMKRKIGYPDKNFDDQFFDDYYKNMTMREDYFYENEMRALWTERIKYLKELNQQYDDSKWELPPYLTNAYYNPMLNEIVFLAGFLQKPSFSRKFPQSLNYGAMGSVIGHEITHGFDTIGSKFDQDGNPFNWWRPGDDQNFHQRVQCLVRQYGNFTAEEVNQKVNGPLTASENVADNGGLKESYRAYQMYVEQHGEERLLPGLNYSHNQLFFLSYAQMWCEKVTPQARARLLQVDTHSPGRFRILGPLRDSEDFAKAFYCPENSPMNPLMKCNVW